MTAQGRLSTIWTAAPEHTTAAEDTATDPQNKKKLRHWLGPQIARQPISYGTSCMPGILIPFTMARLDIDRPGVVGGASASSKLIGISNHDGMDGWIDGTRNTFRQTPLITPYRIDEGGGAVQRFKCVGYRHGTAKDSGIIVISNLISP